MKTAMATFLYAMLLIGSSQLMAKTKVEIEWQNPEKFHDVKPAMESRKRFRESTFKSLDEYIQKLGEQLPDNTKLLITVTDLDLAGQVLPSSFIGMNQGMSDVRIVQDLYIPRMSFSYQLISNTGDILQESEVELKDMSFMNRANQLFRSETLRYEKNMLKGWFEEEFSSQIQKS